MEKFKFLLKNKFSYLPKTPGVYAFKKGKKLLYIGKAVNLQERVKNHPEMLKLADQVGYIKTDSEPSTRAKLGTGLVPYRNKVSGTGIEALILEANLIKKYQPKHNVVWRDDKNYFYICIAKQDFPCVFITHQIKNERGRTSFIGPFVNGKALKQTLKILRKVFPYRTCKNMPKKPCLWYQLNRCPAPCLFQTKLGKQIDRSSTYLRRQTSFKKEYKRNIKNLLKILQGRKRQVLTDLKNEMKKLSKGERFEEAGKIRNQIISLEKILANSRVFDSIETKEVRPLSSKEWPYQRIEGYDISNIQGEMATGAMVTFIDGKPEKNLYRKFKIKTTDKPNDTAMLREVLSRRFKHKEWDRPDLLLIDGGIAQLNAALKVKSQISNLKSVKIMAIAKRNNELYVEGRKKPVLLKSLPRETFNLILQIRDEAHRLAKTYHHQLRKKSLLE